MTRHLMAYVEMAQNVRAELGTHPLVEDLKDAELMLLDAEQAAVKAYGLWRDLMEQASADSPRAVGYVRRTTWDLT